MRLDYQHSRIVFVLEPTKQFCTLSNANVPPDNPVSYFSSLVKIKKIEGPDISEADNNFLKVRRFLYKNQLEEALNEIEKISPNYGQKFEGWIKSCRNLVKFEKLLNFFESMPIEPGNNN